MCLDPTLLEEACMKGEMTIVMNVHREICTISKSGGTPTEMDQIKKCAMISAIKTTELTNLIRAAVVFLFFIEIFNDFFSVSISMLLVRNDYKSFY